MGFTIRVRPYSNIREENLAVAALFPGHLLELTSANKVQKHSQAGKNVIPMFALEDENQGNGVDDAYAANDLVDVWLPQPGDVVLAVLKDGQSIVIGDLLESAGDGTLVKHVADIPNGTTTEVYPKQIVGQALEALDLSGSSGTEAAGALGYDKRLKIRIV